MKKKWNKECTGKPQRNPDGDIATRVGLDTVESDVLEFPRQDNAGDCLNWLGDDPPVFKAWLKEMNTVIATEFQGMYQAKGCAVQSSCFCDGYCSTACGEQQVDGVAVNTHFRDWVVFGA